jgi:hypothetical protein
MGPGGGSGNPLGGMQGDGAGGAGDGSSGLPPTPGDFLECAADRFEAGRGRAGNIVWVIDSSGSMDEEAALVQENLNQFVESIVQAGLSDYRVVVMTEQGFVSVPEPLGSDTAHYRFVDEEVGSEEPLSDLLGRYGDYADFLLPGATTHFVVVTDDESEIPASEFVASMQGELGAAPFRVHAIASPPGAPSAPPEQGNDWEDLFGGGDDDDTGCVGTRGNAAAPGAEHWEAAALTEGLTFSICEEDWSGLFSELATAVSDAATIPCELPLPAPESGSLDENLVNVVLSTDGQAAQAIPRVQGSSACGSNAGWYYDAPDAPSRIFLCPSSCQVAQTAALLDIALGCDTLVE